MKVIIFLGLITAINLTAGSPYENQVVVQFIIYSIIEEACVNGDWQRTGKVYLDIKKVINDRISFDYLLRRTGLGNGVVEDYQDILRNLNPNQTETFLLEPNRVLFVDTCCSWVVFPANITYG